MIFWLAGVLSLKASLLEKKFKETSFQANFCHRQFYNRAMKRERNGNQQELNLKID